MFLREGERLRGGIGLLANHDHNHAEIGYWIGVPFWGNGYCTEAVREVLKYGFDNLKLKPHSLKSFLHKSGIRTHSP